MEQTGTHLWIEHVTIYRDIRMYVVYSIVIYSIVIYSIHVLVAPVPGQTVVIRAAPPCRRAATARELHENHMHQQDIFLCVLCLFVLVKKTHGQMFSKGHTCTIPWQNASYLHDPRSPVSSELEEVAVWIRETHSPWFSDHS